MAFEMLSNVYLGNPLIAWIYFFATIALFVVISKTLLHLSKTFGRKITGKIKGNLDDLLIDLLEEPVVFIVFVAGTLIGYQFLSFPPSIDFYFSNSINLLFLVGGTWLAMRIVGAFLESTLRPLTSKTNTNFDDQLLPILKKTIKAIIITIAIIIALDNFGIDVFTLVTGLGIGGLAFAFAAQKTIADAFGGLSILISRPFIVGDYVEFDDRIGSVEEISLRHTKIRDLDKRIVVVPNSTLASSIVTNITSAPQRKVVWKLGVEYSTSVKKLEKAKKIIEKAIKGCKLCEKEPIVAFDEFSDSSLNILVLFFTKTGAWGDQVKAKDEVGLKIKKEFEKAKIEFAFPTQTIHLKK